jgi:hypothetical protein
VSVDRPRRALLEESDDVESYVARRSRGFTPADHSEPPVSRPARAARALEPTLPPQTGAESDKSVFSDPLSRPRRALPSESLIPDSDQEMAATLEAALGRRAMDPLPSRFTQSDPKPRRSAPSPSPEPAVERSSASAYRTSAPTAAAAPPQATSPTAPSPQAALPSASPQAGFTIVTAADLSASTAAPDVAARAHTGPDVALRAAHTGPGVAARANTDDSAHAAARRTGTATAIDGHPRVTAVVASPRAASGSGANWAAAAGAPAAIPASAYAAAHRHSIPAGTSAGRSAIAAAGATNRPPQLRRRTRHEALATGC